jgi:hypothetical protein
VEWGEAEEGLAAREVEEVREQEADPEAVGLARAEQVCGEPEEAAEPVRVAAARAQAARAAEQVAQGSAAAQEVVGREEERVAVPVVAGGRVLAEDQERELGLAQVVDRVVLGVGGQAALEEADPVPV